MKCPLINIILRVSIFKFVLKKHENESFHVKNKPSEKAVKDLKDCVLASILQRPKSVFHSILPADFRKMGDF